MALATEQQGVVLADEGLCGQQEGGGESRQLPFGDSYGTCVPRPCGGAESRNLGKSFLRNSVPYNGGGSGFRDCTSSVYRTVYRLILEENTILGFFCVNRRSVASVCIVLGALKFANLRAEDVANHYNVGGLVE